MNKVLLIGRLTADPEVRYTQKDDLCVAMFTVAVYRNQDESDFIRCKALGAVGEFAEKSLEKGMRVGVEGSWHTGSYENKDGETVYFNECFVNKLEFADGKKQEEGNRKGGKRR